MIEKKGSSEEVGLNGYLEKLMSSDCDEVKIQDDTL
jgi:hypothetical protein